MVEVKKFSGILDTDTPEAEVNYNYHIDAKNVVFRGDGVGKRVQNIVGNVSVENNLLPSSGNNLTIGTIYDSVKKRIFTFNYNSSNIHGIYIYNLIPNTWERLIEVGSSTDGDILQFNPDVQIHSINILYGGDGSIDGDILYYIDSLKRPTQINIDAYLNNTYAVVKRSFINVIKAPPKKVPQVTYENDTTVSVNNLKNGLYQFRTRFKYDNNEKSVYSAASIVPLPYNITNSPNTSEPSKNARIAVYVETGDETVKNIEIIGKRTTDNSVEGWFLIASLNKQELNINDNTFYKYLFYNDGAYTLVDQEETTQLFDYVPDEANTQELLNGNVPIYGGIKEGYNLIDTNASIQVSSIKYTYQYYNGLLFFGYKKANGNLVLVVTGCGTNNGSNEPISLDNAYADFYVTAKDSAYTDIGFSYSAGSVNQTISTILDALVASSASTGWSLVTQTTNTIELSYSGATYFGDAFTFQSAIGSNITSQDTTFSFSEASKYDFGLVYYTEQGKTNGVIYPVSWNISTPNIDSSNKIPTVQFTISHRPPLWANYYHIVRTDNETYESKLYWISNGAYKADAINDINNTSYAYINISSIVDFSTDLNTTGGGVSYEFTKGDRIRFLGVYNNPSDINDLNYYTNPKDYEIIGFKTNPFINGVRQEGNFIQIVYPANDISSDFKFDGSYLYMNYYVLIYTPKKTINKDNLPFFEFAKTYEIGNAGTTNAFHFGQQMQSVDLVTSCVVKVSDGDLFSRIRNVPKNASKSTQAGDFFVFASSNSVTVPLTFENAPITVSGGTINNQPFLPAGDGASDYPTSAATDFLYQNTAPFPLKIRIRFDGKAGAGTAAGGVVFYLKMVNNPVPVSPVVLQKVFSVSIAPNEEKDFDVDFFFNVYNGSKVFLLAGNLSTTTLPTVTYNSFKIDVINANPVQVIEKTYNDYYPIQANSNGRPTVIDKDAARIYCPTLLRWGLSYQQNTNINNTNRFKSANFDECDRSKGDIQRFKARQRVLRVFQKRGVGQYGVYARFIQNNNGESQLVTTNDIITANNIQYYAGDYGVGDYPTSLVSASMQDYFVDPNRGYQVRLSGDGLTTISEIYKGQYLIRNLLTKYNRPYIRPNGFKANILGYYDYFEEQYVCVLQGGTYSGDFIDTIDDYTFAFNEKNNGYSSFYDFHPDIAICAEDVTYSFLNGVMWQHTNTNNYCNFYGVQYNAYITTVFNENLISKKTWVSLTEIANNIWVCPIIYSNMNSYGTQRQETNLIAQDFATLESNYHASLLRDTHSIGGILNGNQIKGNYIVVKFQANNASNFVFLSEISAKFIISNLTNK